MKNWKLLAVFGLIAVLFVFAGCFAGVTPEEPTATPTQAPTVAPTNTPTPLPEFNGAITDVGFLGDDDEYLNIADSEADQEITGTISGTNIKKVKVYFVKLKAIEPCEECADICGDACAQPEVGDPIFMGEEIFSEAMTGTDIPWVVTIPKAKLAALEDGVYKIFVVAELGLCGSCDLTETQRFYYDDCFTVDLTAPKVTCECCGFSGILDEHAAVADSASVKLGGCCCGTELGEEETGLIAGVDISGTLSENASFKVRAVENDDGSFDVAVYNDSETYTETGVSKGGTWFVSKGDFSPLPVDSDDGITLTLKDAPCADCYDVITLTKGSSAYTAGKVTVGFSECVLVDCAAVVGDEDWTLNDEELAKKNVKRYMNSWTYYNGDTDFAIGDNFKIKITNITDKAGNVTETAYCNGVFEEGTIDSDDLPSADFECP